MVFVSQLCFAETQQRDDQVKALFLLNLTSFFQWPATDPITSSFSNDFLQVCVIGKTPVSQALITMIENGFSPGRSCLAVKHIKSPPKEQECQIVFIGKLQKIKTMQILSEFHQTSMLTVSDMEGFTKIGGMVEFRKRHGKIRLLFNKKIIDQTKLKYPLPSFFY